MVAITLEQRMIIVFDLCPPIVCIFTWVPHALKVRPVLPWHPLRPFFRTDRCNDKHGIKKPRIRNKPVTNLRGKVAKPGFSETVIKEVNTLFDRYPKKINALLPVLHIAQRENAGWLPPGWDDYIAGLCETSVTHVRGVITFYNMFKTKPVGKHHIMVCTCLPCGLCDGVSLLRHLEKKLGVHAGNTTDDGLFSLEEAQCLAACDYAPVMMVNEDLQKRITLEEVDRWIEETKAKKA